MNIESWSEPYTMERVPRRARTPAWLAATAADLHDAAQAWNSPFDVTIEDIAAHVAKAAEVVVMRGAQKVVGFVGASDIVTLRRTGHTARYIDGTIVHPRLGGPRKFARLMEHLPERAEVEVLHTQSVFMAKALADRSEAVFPAAEADRHLTPALFADVRDLLETLNRKAQFCPVTGVAPGFYGRCLYRQWPLPGEHFAGAFRFLAGDSASAIVVIGFGARAQAMQHLAPTIAPGVR